MILPDPLVEAQARDGLLLFFCIFLIFVFLFSCLLVVIFVPNDEINEKDL